jgi:hypothetical protein
MKSMEREYSSSLESTRSQHAKDLEAQSQQLQAAFTAEKYTHIIIPTPHIPTPLQMIHDHLNYYHISFVAELVSIKDL